MLKLETNEFGDPMGLSASTSTVILESDTDQTDWSSLMGKLCPAQTQDDDDAAKSSDSKDGVTWKVKYCPTDNTMHSKL